MSVSVGSQLGHYDVIALIGEGGMGQVYQATDTKLNRQVALKILPEAFTDDTKLSPGDVELGAQRTKMNKYPATRETCNGRQGWSEG